MCLVLSETWLDEFVPDGVVSIPGFRVCRRDRINRGGGVAVYCSDGFKCKKGRT